MVTKKEALALAAGGSLLARSPAARRAAIAGARLGSRALGPVGIAILLAELGYVYQDEIEDVARQLAERMPGPVGGQGGNPTFGADMGVLGGVNVVKKSKRKLSKANKAMKQAMKATKNNFKQATKIASKANPATKSKIGKGATKMKRLARKIRKSVWGVTKRFKK